jgi:hypothetical protein
MKIKLASFTFLLPFLLFTNTGCKTTTSGDAVSGDNSELAKSYANIKVGDYTDAYLHISQCQGKPFLAFMKEAIYPLIVRESKKSQQSAIDGVKSGDGVL